MRSKESLMPKREDINKVLIIGSGPIIIGQACEFDYSGTQAVKALRNLGYEIVLVNSNPATIMTDPEIADVTYIEPLNVKRLEQIIAKERPDALLPNLGGQSGLNLCAELAKEGVLEKYNVQVIGVQVDAIERGEDRIEFKKSMDEIGIEMARSEVSYSVDEALSIADRLGYPVVLRPAYTMGGAGGGLVYNKEELKTVCARGLAASLVGQVLVEESILGWEELELEIVRDSKGQMITVCFIENIDPMGTHTGDSFCAAPMLTISKELQARLQDAAYRIVDSVKVIGGTNVQFAHDPVSDRIVVIEINPRTSRSSALASKATGFPIALVSAMLAAGLTLDEIECGKYGTLDKYVPDGDYIVIKFARWAFEKFKGVEDKLGTQMRAVGEVMSIGKTYKEAFQKAIRSLETGRYGLGFAKDYNNKSKEELLRMLAHPSSDRHFIMYEALRSGASVEEIHEATKVKRYFIEQMKELVTEEEALLAKKGSLPSDEALVSAKKNGFSDKYLSKLLEIPEADIRARRTELGVTQAWEGVHVSSTKDSAYYYSTYNAPDKNPVSTDRKKIMILGGGPNRIGQGIEFDYCCVHAALALKKLGFETIIVNCNPETVSTDYDTSDKLYFEPLTLEDVLSIYQKEQPVGTHAFVPAVMEHIELAGVPSGDSACIIPSVHITPENVATIREYTKKIAEEMHVKGLMNMQYAIENGRVYVLEANPRASRTVPLVSKVCNIRMVPLATEIITAELTSRPSPVPALKEQHIPYYGVKEAVFPFNMFPEVDPVLGPEMRSTGEVLGLSTYYGEAFYKAQEATQTKLPLSGTVLISVNRKDKPEVVEIAGLFKEAGFKILATGTTCDLITEAGIPAERVKKLYEGRPNILDLITNGDISLIINSPIGKESMHDDSYLRKAAIKEKVPYMTTIAAARATAKGILYVQKHGDCEVKSLQQLHSEIKNI